MRLLYRARLLHDRVERLEEIFMNSGEAHFAFSRVDPVATGVLAPCEFEIEGPDTGGGNEGLCCCAAQLRPVNDSSSVLLPTS